MTFIPDIHLNIDGVAGFGRDSNRIFQKDSIGTGGFHCDDFRISGLYKFCTGNCFTGNNEIIGSGALSLADR